jgi:prophage regulatory protein
MPRTLAPIQTILRRKRVESETGLSRSTIYLYVGKGLFPRPVRLGPRAVGWPSAEVAALNAARIAGKSDADIRLLVSTLEAARR